MTNLTVNAQKLLKIALECDSDLYDAGMNWYQDAHDYAVTLAERYGYELWQAAGVIAALSPQTGWEPNKVAADRVMHLHSQGLAVSQQDAGQTQANVTKALQILDGIDLNTVLAANMPRSGHKVWSFVNNIVAPSVSQAVTVDRHAIKAWMVDESWSCITPNRYATIQCDYQAVARAMGILPSQAQAVIWCAVRGTAA